MKALGRDIRRGIHYHSEGKSSVLAAECMLPSGGPDDPKRKSRMVRILPPGLVSGTVPDGVRADESIFSCTALGKFVSQISPLPYPREDYKIASEHMRKLPAFLKAGGVPIPNGLMPSGLAGIGKGFEKMKAGRFRGQEFVVSVGG